jgi:aminotransferase
MAGIGRWGFDDDALMARHLIERAAVATVPASSFYHEPVLGRRHLRFSFPKRLETIERGVQALRALAPGGRSGS